MAECGRTEIAMNFLSGAMNTNRSSPANRRAPLCSSASAPCSRSSRQSLRAEPLPARRRPGPLAIPLLDPPMRCSLSLYYGYGMTRDRFVAIFGRVWQKQLLKGCQPFRPRSNPVQRATPQPALLSDLRLELRRPSGTLQLETAGRTGRIGWRWTRNFA